MADGSDDAHPEVGRICREYASRDTRIRYRKLDENRGIAGNTNACLEMATGNFIGLFDHDDLLHPAALFEVMRAICETGADFVYTDEASFVDKPEVLMNIHFKPAFSPDSLRSHNYICHFSAFKRSLLDEVGLFEPACDGSQDHDMALRLTEKAKRIAHIPEVLYYWRVHAKSTAGGAGAKPYTVAAGVRAVERSLQRMGLEGEVSSVAENVTIYRIRYALQGTPKVSILIPNRDHYDDLKACLDSVFEKTTYPNYEIVIVENNSTQPALFPYYGELQRTRDNVRVVTWQGDGGFNYPALNNFGAQYCTGEYLLLLNNDTRIITPDWIQEMLMYAQRADVGAVGAKLFYPDGTIQHAGVIVSTGHEPIHYYTGTRKTDTGYTERLNLVQDVSAVTAACMLVRRSVWDEVGGLDEAFAVAYNDVDFCLRIRKAGYLVVWTPFAELEHFESKSRGIDGTAKKQQRRAAEVALLNSRWHDYLDKCDPYYNPNFLPGSNNFAIDCIAQPHDARYV